MLSFLLREASGKPVRRFSVNTGIFTCINFSYTYNKFIYKPYLIVGMGRIPKPTAEAIVFEQEADIAVDTLKLDKQNNRLTHLVIKDEQELEERLWREGKLANLKNDIKARGLQEPLVLFPESLTVAEGNCRLVCLKRLQREAENEEKKDKPFASDPRLQHFLKLHVLCKRIVKNTPIVDIDAYLTEIHVGRKKKWPEYNQAKLLFKLKDDDDLTLEEIARISRSSRPTISKKIEAYRHTSTYHERFPDDTDYIRWFYYFWEFMHPSLDKFRRDNKKVKKFMKWIHDGKFSRSRDVRILPHVLDNPEALKKFEETNMNNARQIIIKVDPTSNSPLYRRITGLSTTFDAMPPREVRLLLKDHTRRELLRNLIKAATTLLNEVEKGDEDEE